MKTVTRTITKNNTDVSKLQIQRTGQVILMVDTSNEIKNIYMPTAKDTMSIIYRIINIGNPAKRLNIYPKKGSSELLSDERVLCLDHNGEVLILTSDGSTKYW